MRNFQKLGTFGPLPLLHAVQRQAGLWNQHKTRTEFENSPHAEVDDIWLRATPEPQGEMDYLLNSLESINYPALLALPQARPVIFDLMRTVEGEQLGRILITRLRPGGVITPHIDSGRYAEFFDRYHCILQNGPGSNFISGSEQCYMAPGEVWWFDNKQVHSVVNNSVDDRLTMIVDVRTTR